MMSLNYQMVLILCYILKIISHISLKTESLTKISPIHIYIKRINNRLVLKIKNAYKLELQMPETMKLFGSASKVIDKRKNGENVSSLEVAEVVLV